MIIFFSVINNNGVGGSKYPKTYYFKRLDICREKYVYNFVVGFVIISFQFLIVTQIVSKKIILK